MAYCVTLDFNDFNDNLTDVWSTRLNLPNGAVLPFWNCLIKYVNSNDTHYLTIESGQKQNIEECLQVFSFFTTLPLFTFKYDFYNSEDILVEKLTNNLTVVEWREKLAQIERSLKFKANRKRRDEILSLMNMCSIGALHEYREHREERFFMYFKPIEKVAKLVLETRVLNGKDSDNRKKITKNLLNQLLLSNFNNTSFDENTLNELVGKLHSVFESSLVKTNHRRIVLALSAITDKMANGDSTKTNLLKINSSRIQQLVKTRNDIAHGNRVTITSKDLGDVEFLSRQMISQFFLGFSFNQGYLKTKKFGIDFWS